MKTQVVKFVAEMLVVIRREFFPKYSDKYFFQERLTLIQSITWPAKWMNDRGVKAPASVYRRILWTVIDTIKRHGNQVKFRRFSLYFFKAVQEHMNHHGEEYYYQAKVRPIGDILPAVARQLQPNLPRGLPITEVLSQLNQALKSPGGRRRAIPAGQQALLPSFPAVKGRKLHEAAP